METLIRHQLCMKIGTLHRSQGCLRLSFPTIFIQEHSECMTAGRVIHLITFFSHSWPSHIGHNFLVGSPDKALKVLWGQIRSSSRLRAGVMMSSATAYEKTSDENLIPQKWDFLWRGERERERKGLLWALNLIYQMFSYFYIFSMALPRVSKWPDIAGTTRPERVRLSNSQMQYDPYLFLPFCTPNGKFNGGHRPIITHNPLWGQLKIHVWLKGRILYQLLELLGFSLCMCTDIYLCGGGKLGQWNWLKKLSWQVIRVTVKKNKIISPRNPTHRCSVYHLAFQCLPLQGILR